MASKVPIVSQVARVSIIPQAILLGLFIFGFYLTGIGFPFILGPLTYLALSYGLRNVITRNHQKGMKLVKQENFIEAIPFFEESVKYFSEKAWVDKYRFLAILSSSRMSYREMGLCNIAFCYGQTGNGLKAKELYRSVLNDYPENVLATTAVRLFDSLEIEVK